MHRNKMFLAFLGLTAFSIILCSAFDRGNFVMRDYSSINLDGIDNLMIVAHPDDEILWGGGHLIQDKYLVVCITAGKNEVRAVELIKAMKETDDKYIMLGYPDKNFFGERDKWEKCRGDIKEKLEKIIALKKWKNIVTHNAEGEYGHIHHKMTNSIVTKLYQKLDNNYTDLYYFGKYYTKEDTSSQIDKLIPLDSELVVRKTQIIKDIYRSQDFIIAKFGQMIAYENWEKYDGE